jgi:hypothetical protein
MAGWALRAETCPLAFLGREDGMDRPLALMATTPRPAPARAVVVDLTNHGVECCRGTARESDCGDA